MTIQHEDITDPYLHEPKGIAAATSGQVYVSDGAGGGSWVDLDKSVYGGGYVTFDSVTPAYTQALTTSDSVFNPTFLTYPSQNINLVTTPNDRWTYTGTEDAIVDIITSLSLQQTSGGSADIEVVLYLNGVALEGSRLIRSATNNAWGRAATSYKLQLSTNDYLEVFARGDASFTMNVAQATVTINGFKI